MFTKKLPNHTQRISAYGVAFETLDGPGLSAKESRVKITAVDKNQPKKLVNGISLVANPSTNQTQ